MIILFMISIYIYIYIYIPGNIRQSLYIGIDLLACLSICKFDIKLSTSKDILIKETILIENTLVH